MICCMFCDKPVDSEDMCCTCGYVDPLRCLEGNFSYSTKKDLITALITSLDTQLSSDKHTTALSKQLPELREAFAECAALRKVAAEEGEAFQQDINDINASTRFKKTLLDAYKNNNYTINLDDHQKETDMRVRAGVWEVIRCPSHDCKGRAFKTTGQCSICQASVCFDCFETKDGHHVCDEAKKASVQTMMTSSVPCPLCFTPIQKKEGCDQIFCVMCHHAFDFQSHTTISRTHLHNPEFRDFLDLQGVQEKGKETAWVEEHLSLKRRDDVIANIIGHQDAVPSGDADNVLVRGTARTLVMYRPYMTKQHIHLTALRFGIVSNADDSVVAAISVKQNGWWSRVMGSDKEVINRFDNWLRDADMYGVLLTLSKRVKAIDDDVPDTEDVLSKIKWMQGEMSDNCYANEVFTRVHTSAFDRFKWNTLKRHFLTGMVALNAVVLRCMQQIYSEAQAFTAAPSDADVFITRIERAINTCLDTVDILMPDAQGTVATITHHPEQLTGTTGRGTNVTTCYKAMLKQIRSKSINSRIDCFVCCKDDGKKNSIGCIQCSRPACLACLDQWWTSDACKMHVTMPCCKTPAIDLLYVCSNNSQIDRQVRHILKGPLQNAVLEQERTKRFRYEQFVRNKRHADSLVCDVGNNKVMQMRLRAKRQEANERVKHLLSGAGLAKQLRVRNSDDGLGALELYCCSLETPFLAAETTDSTLSGLPKALQQAEDNDTPVDVDLITRMRSEYHVLEILQTALVSSITRRLQKAHAQGSIHEVSSLTQTGLTLGYSIDNALDRAGQHGSGPKYRLRDLMSNIRGSELYIKQVFESFSLPPKGDSHKRKRLM